MRSSGTQKRRSCSVLTLALLHHRRPRAGHGVTSPGSRPDGGVTEGGKKREAGETEAQGRLRTPKG